MKRHISEIPKGDLEKFKTTGTLSICTHDQLDHFVNDLSDTEKLSIMEKIYILAAKYLTEGIDFSEAFSVLDQKNFSSASCKRGCSYCCYINVDVIEAEAKNIYDKHKNKIDWPRANFLSKHNSPQKLRRIDLKSRACLFLQNNECQIYEDRPMACRSFYVVSNPKYCKTAKVKNVRRLIDLKVEMMRAVLFTVGHYTDSGSLPLMLKKQAARETIGK